MIKKAIFYDLLIFIHKIWFKNGGAGVTEKAFWWEDSCPP